jgi:uncharacterized membrane protein YesL
MFKQVLVLGAVFAIIVCALFIDLYILDWVKFPELMENVRKLLVVIAVSTAAALSIMALVKVAEKK